MHMSWHTSIAHTGAPNPQARAQALASGNSENSGMNDATPAINTRLGPQRRTIRAKNSAWDTPTMQPSTERHRPISSGVNPSPPNSAGVARKSGIRQRSAESRKESVP